MRVLLVETTPFKRLWSKGHVFLRGWLRSTNASPANELFRATPIQLVIGTSGTSEKAWRARVASARRALNAGDHTASSATCKAVD
jgi:hypothetical protein